MKNWYIEGVEGTAEAFCTNTENGISDEQLQRAREQYGKNKLREREGKPLSQRFFAHFKNLMAVVLLITAFVSIVVEIAQAHGKQINIAEPLIIMAVVILNISLCVFREYRAERSLAELRRLSIPLSTVRRNGRDKVIPSEDIVPGDIVLIKSGDIIPADGRIIRCSNFKCDESVLTGVNTPSEKNAAAVIDVTCPLSDRINMVFSGCCAVSGDCEFIVTATGMHTELGSISGILAGDEEAVPPLQKQLLRFGKAMGSIALAACTVFFILGSFVTDDLLYTFLTAASLSLAAIPEGMISAVVSLFAQGIRKMTAKNVIIKDPSTVESLSNISVICSDKTGPLTLNKMSLVRAWAYEDNTLRDIESLNPTADSSVVQLIQLSALCCDARLEKDGSGSISEVGDRMEAAIVAALMNLGQEKKTIEAAYKRVAEIPFDSERRLMTTVHSTDSGIISITKGAPDALLPLCIGADNERTSAILNSMCGDALKVLAVACKRLTGIPDRLDREALESSLTFVGFIGIADYSREDARAAVKTCHDAGIRTVMITGDHIDTASASAVQLDILTDGDNAIACGQLAEMSDSELHSNIRKYSVYARASSADKLRIIKAWQEAGEVVAVTGSAVGDASALEAADVGCALGNTGSDTAKAAASLLLTDDNFSSIVSAVKEGRKIFESIRRSVMFMLSCNLSEITAALICLLLHKSFPLAAMHFLIINLLRDFLITPTLGSDSPETNVMHRRPRSRDTKLLDRSFLITTAIPGITLGIIAVIAFSVGISLSEGNTAVAVTMCFGTLFLSQLVYAFTLRTDKTVFSSAIFSDRSALLAYIISIVAFVATMLTSPLMKLFSLASLSGTMWLWVLLLSILPLPVGELAKLVFGFDSGRQ